MKTLKKIIIFTVMALLILFSIEMILRFAGNLYLKRLYIHKYYNVKDHTNAINIMCLGESSTAGLWVPSRDSYPSQLQGMLRREYPEKRINVLVPPHVGQNTSEMLNRIERHIKLYKPCLIIVMAGYNNEWSLAESHIGRFLKLNNFENTRITALILLNNFRLFKMLRYAHLKFIVKEESVHVRGLENMDYIWGGPELVRLPQRKFIYSFADSHRDAFVELWKYDIKGIISAAKRHNIRVILMTYQINPTYLPAEEFIGMAQEEGTMLIRNDITFQALIDNETIKDYLLWDNWHPNKKGYSLIAKNVFETIKNSEDLLEVIDSSGKMKEYSARFELAGKYREKGSLKFIFQITNMGENTWKKERPDRIKVGCRIYDEGKGQKDPIMELRQELPRSNIAKGDTFQSQFIIDSALFKRGVYVLKFDMVSERRFWFEDIMGSSPFIERIGGKF